MFKIFLGGWVFGAFLSMCALFIYYPLKFAKKDKNVK